MPKNFNSLRRVDGADYERFAAQTHLIGFGEDLAVVLKKYALLKMRKGDWLALSEKVVSVAQNNVRHISTVRVGWLAKLVVKGVKKYKNDKGWDSPPKMQLVVEAAGTPRVLLAMALGALGKLFGIRGVFWRVVGERLGEIDGFNPAVMPPYNEWAALPPLRPEKTCDDLEKSIGYPVIIIDGNDINVKVIAMSSGMPLNKATARLVLLDNPMGQEREMTPFIIVRKKAVS